MKQEQFVARYQQEWQDLEQWLLLRAGASRRARRKASGLALDDTAFPQPGAAPAAADAAGPRRRADQAVPGDSLW
ncbi:hypothetical protein G6F56_014523 [Rhizopus delemar]|nr:hypothetical protein G6F60_014582 [Rhizopus arrhizus]KAG1433752.1 hypothetical protein G6F56_014523 [Rhizopus delemar]